jgi:hypothetical protein
MASVCPVSSSWTATGRNRTPVFCPGAVFPRPDPGAQPGGAFGDHLQHGSLRDGAFHPRQPGVDAAREVERYEGLAVPGFAVQPREGIAVQQPVDQRLRYGQPVEGVAVDQGVPELGEQGGHLGSGAVLSRHCFACLASWREPDAAGFGVEFAPHGRDLSFHAAGELAGHRTPGRGEGHDLAPAVPGSPGLGDDPVEVPVPPLAVCEHHLQQLAEMAGDGRLIYGLAGNGGHITARCHPAGEGAERHEEPFGSGHWIPVIGDGVGAFAGH